MSFFLHRISSFLLHVCVYHYFNDGNNMSQTNNHSNNEDVDAVDLQFVLRFFAWRTFKTLCSSLASIHSLFYPARRGLIAAPDNPLLDLTITDLVRGIKGCLIKSEDVVQAYIDRIHIINPLINAVVDERFADALAEARAIDRQLRSASLDNETRAKLMLKPLLGVPFTCKDSIEVRNLIQSAGSLHRKNVKSETDAPAVAKLRAAGAIPIAITNVPEMLLWWDSSNLIYGTTKNPYDLSRIAGGSSGGEAALLAASGTAFGLGSDIGGSIRIPSALNGVFGHKTSPYIVSTDGMYPEVSSGLRPFVSFGPMTKRAAELPLILKAMADEQDIKRLRLDEPVDLKCLSMIWMENEGGNPLFSKVSPEIIEKLHSAVNQIQSTYGIPAQKVNFPVMIHTMHMWSACLAKGDPRSINDLLEESSGRIVNPFVEIMKSILGLSTFSFNILFLAAVQRILGIKRDTVSYYKLNKIADRLREQVIEMLGENGFLLCPTMPEEAPRHSSTVLKGADVALCGIFNVLGLPSTHVPLGLNRNGLPIGVQVVSRPDNDRICLAVASVLEKMFGGFVHP
jgi:fatty acid amide hydrolase 2